MQIGNEFRVSVLGDTLYYKVVDIKVVLPDETDYLKPEKGRDLVTLVTCTPYSVNTHRLLVTGERTKAPKGKVAEEEKIQIIPTDTIIYISLFGVVFVIDLMIIIRKTKRKKKIEK